MMSVYTLAFCTSFIFIGLKSWQQLNVVHKKFWWIVPTSMSMAICEVFIIASAAKNGWGWIVLPIGLGGGLGSLSSTWLHYKFLEKE
jgi:hypothetical protein